MAHGGSAMTHGGAPANPGARYPDKVRISFLGPRRTSLRYYYGIR